MRYRHNMAKAKGERQPSAVVAVSCETAAISVDEQPNMERIRLVRWYASAVQLVDKRAGSARQSTGTTAASFWQALDWLLRRGGTVLIVSSGAVLDWSLLEMWEGLERGTIYCGGNARTPDTSSGGGMPSLPQVSGAVPVPQGRNTKRNVQQLRWEYLVLEDPPSIASFRVAGRTATIKWVDAGNYGISEASLPRQPCYLAEAMLVFALNMVATLTERRLGGLRDTSASQALYSYRRKHLKTIICCHTVKPVLELEAAAYYSGRCECGVIGHVEGPIYELDIRGSYLYCCLHSPVPVRLRAYGRDNGLESSAQHARGRARIAEVTVRTSEPAYPVRSHGITIWPLGIMRTVLCGPELADAEERQRVAQYHWSAWYDLEPALAGWAQECCDGRCQAEANGNKLLATWWKALAVSLVGKLAQRGAGWVWCPEKKPFLGYDQYYQRHTDGRMTRFQEIAGRHRRETVSGWAPDAVPAIAGWICSAARMRLLAMLRCCGFAECVYRDTDSLFVTETGYRKLQAANWIRPNELGFLQERGQHEWIKCLGIKTYRTPQKEVAAGRSLDAQAPSGATDRTRYYLWAESFLQRHQRPAAESVVTPFVHSQPYRHGTVTAGGRVEPLWDWSGLTEAERQWGE